MLEQKRKMYEVIYFPPIFKILRSKNQLAINKSSSKNLWLLQRM